MKVLRFLQLYDTTVVVAALLAVGFGITWTTIGPGEALRGFAAELVILAVTFYIARQYLPWEDAPKERIERPKIELAVGLAAYGLLLAGAFGYLGGLVLTTILLGLIIPIGVLLTSRYSSAAWGLRWPTLRQLAVLLAIILIKIILGGLFNTILPKSEMALPAGIELNAESFSILLASVAGLGLLFALQSEFFYRVFLQPRLAAFLPGRWAMFVQAVLYSLVSIPFYLSLKLPLPYVLALTLVLSSGIMSGYFWRKTGSLPLLILLHLLAFPRYGL